MFIFLVPTFLEQTERNKDMVQLVAQSTSVNIFTSVPGHFELLANTVKVELHGCPLVMVRVHHPLSASPDTPNNLSEHFISVITWGAVTFNSVLYVCMSELNVTKINSEPTRLI